MSEEMENVEEVSVEEALQMEIIFGQALMDVLVTKGVISEQEVLDRVEEIKQETGFELSQDFLWLYSPVLKVSLECHPHT